MVTQDPALADRIDALLGDFESTTRPARTAHIIQITGRPRERYRLYKGCHQTGAKDSGEALLPNLVSVINQAAIEAMKQFAVHAAVVYGVGFLARFDLRDVSIASQAAKLIASESDVKAQKKQRDSWKKATGHAIEGP